MQLNPAEISELIKSRIQGLAVSTDIRNQGTVVSVTDGICRVHGLSEAMQGEMLEFPAAPDGSATYGLALNLERDSVGAVILGEYEHISEGGKITEFSDVEEIDPEDLVAVPCDVFIPAALGGMIREDNADRMNCKVLVEGANSPTTPNADEILADNEVHVVPDVMANAGGVIVSYFEWVQNLQHFRWEEDAVNHQLETMMKRAYHEVAEKAREDEISLRLAAYQMGIERVLAAARTRGYVN